MSDKNSLAINTITKSKIIAFRKKVLTHYKEKGRTFPWRDAHAIGTCPDPYKVLVSELMLQQTQVDRVIPKYNSFTEKYPSWKALASAPLSEILEEWQGLGYNRRAVLLYRCATAIVTQYNSVFPSTADELQKLPGIGPYTANAICAFAFDKPTMVIETNIRTALIHEFYPHEKKVSDELIIPLIEKTLDKTQPCVWYNALMDYGAMLKRTEGNFTQRSTTYVKQARFKGSDREIRGEIMRLVLRENYTIQKLSKKLKKFSNDSERLQTILHKMKKDGMIHIEGKTIAIAKN